MVQFHFFTNPVYFIVLPWYPNDPHPRLPMSNKPVQKSVWFHFKVSCHKVQYLDDPCRSALSAVRPGGLVVYSTCTLSSFENHAVVEAALSDFPEAEPEDLWDEIAVPLSKHFAFSFHPGHGQTTRSPSLRPQKSAVPSYRNRLGVLVVPQPGRTWGPMFLSRIRRRK